MGRQWECVHHLHTTHSFPLRAGGEKVYDNVLVRVRVTGEGDEVKGG